MDDFGNAHADAIARNLRRPENGPVGSLVKEFLKTNVREELNAARLCRIESHHDVLELGFGLGLGLEEAYVHVRDGTGTVSGIDISQAMFDEARGLLNEEIQAGKVRLTLGSVDNMLFDSNSFDRIFHCNCYYFWPDIDAAAGEIFRVMKPGSLMVTVLDLSKVRAGQEKGRLKYGNPDPHLYIESLERAGFSNVTMENMKRADSSEYQAIFAYVPN